MKAGYARSLGVEWVETQAKVVPSYAGAFLVGSINTVAEDEDWPPHRDVDVRIVVDLDNGSQFQEKGLGQTILSYRGVVIDTGYDPMGEFATPEQILSSYARACHFAWGGVVSDPSGHLMAIQREVMARYAQREWVEKRLAGVRRSVQAAIERLRGSTDLSRSYSSLFFVVLGIAQLAAIADLANPTMRTCLVQFKKQMDRLGVGALHESILRLLGSETMSRDEVGEHLGELTRAFDYGLRIIRKPHPTGFVSEIARHIALGGAWDVVHSGHWREAILWIAGMRMCCQEVIDADAPAEEVPVYVQGYIDLLGSMGLRSADDIRARVAMSERLYQDVVGVVPDIIAANPAIV
jgi:hypothetical protein